MIDKYNPFEYPIKINCTGSDLVKLDQIKKFQGNLKRLSEKNRSKLVASICEHGFSAPFFIWRNGDELNSLDGTQRRDTLLYMQDLGWEVPMLPVVYIDAADEKEARKILLRISSQYGEFEIDELQNWLDEFDQEFADSLRITDEELKIDVSVEPEETEGDDEVPEEVQPVTKLGDIWKLGEHRLLCGDSMKSEDVEKLMNGQNADMVFTDPPYGVEYQSNIRTKTDKFELIKNDDSFLDISPIIDKFSNGWVFVWTSWKVQNRWIDIFKNYGYPTNIIIWYKPGGRIGDLKKTFSSDYEVALVWNRGAELTGKRIGSVWKINKDGASTYVHPTQKPVELSVEALDKTTNKNDIILDLFGGSGSTLLGAEKTGRISRLMELDPHYCDVIRDRYIQWCEKNSKTPIVKLNGEIWNG